MNLRYLILANLLSLFIILVPSVFAVGKPDTAGRPETVTGRQNEERRQLVQKRLNEAKLKACRARENAIKKRAEGLGRMASNMMEKFDAVVKRVKDFYASKVIPSGKTVANYDGLVSDIQAKKGVVQTALTTAQNNAGSFSCDGSDPKGQLSQFRDEMQAVKSALKDYRTSIKNLIVAVHSVFPKE